MKTKMKNLVLSIALLGGIILTAAWSANNGNLVRSQSGIPNTILPAGISTSIPAYYDHALYTIQFTAFTGQAAATLIAKNPGINFIYQSDPGLPGGLPFISVIDAIPTDGMNPVWREVQIAFNPGFTPIQFFKDDDVLAAASGPNPMINLVYTNEVYTCPVMGFPK